MNGQQQQVQQLIHRANFLRQNPAEQRQPNELENIMKYIQSLSRGPEPVSHQPQPAPTPQPTPPSFTPAQIEALRNQIQAYRHLSKGQPVPLEIQKSLRAPNTAIPDLEALLTVPSTPAKIVDSTVKVAKADSALPEDDIPDEDAAAYPKGPFLEDDTNSGIYPYNAYSHPFTHLKRPADAAKAAFITPELWATRMQRLLVPTIMPAGLDAHQIVNERERYVEARIEQRIRELESLPVSLGGLNDAREDDEGALTLQSLAHAPAPKLKALIELKALRLLHHQRAARAQLTSHLAYSSLLPLSRLDLRRAKKVGSGMAGIRDARNTEQLERKQRVERERRAKGRHTEQLGVICTHGARVKEANRAAHDRMTRLGRAVLSFHANTEREEQKRIERLAKERLKALKADDEEAYMKLIDTAKDTRITHLLRQTDSYLEGLASAVVAQQNEAGGLPTMGGQWGVEMEDGPASEATFGAQVNRDDERAPDDKKVDYYAIAHRISEKITRQPSILVGGTLKEYQLKGLQWMVSLYNNKLNGILADEMGLGKTIQTISLITFLIEVKRQRGPYLVIVPLSTMTNWSGEFAKWAPGVKMISYKGNPAQRRNLQGELRMGQFQVLLTTYEYIIKDRPILSKIKWVHMIIDEGHRMKNTQSKLAVTLTTYYHSRYRLILTGTPLQNNLPELWALLNFVLPKVFNSVKSFDEWFNTPFANSGTGDKIELNEEEALLIIKRLHKVLRPFLLRRLKKDVESELPDKVEKVIKVRMSALQSQLYKQMKKHKMIADGGRDGKKGSGVKGLSNELMQLRKICQHPFLFESVEDRVNPTGFIDKSLVRTSGKLELLNRILPKFFKAGHRVLIFFQMTKVMDIMEDFMKMMGWKYLRLDGGTKTEERASFVQLFNAKESEYKVFILSTRAGGLGLNLQTADTVIIFDSDWNPHADLQAQDRAHRIGQTKAVLILRFITEKSVEEAMYQRARYKLDIDDKVIQAGRFDNKSTQEEQEEFLRSILEADQEEENEEAGDMNDDELNELLARGDEEAALFREMDAQREREALEAWRAAGNKGKPPPPLIQLEELPDCYQSDEPFAPVELDDTMEGRGQRKRTVVSYNDGLDDDTWAMALEDGEDLDELAERAKKERRAPNKLIKEDGSARGTPASDGGAGRKKKGKGRAAVDDYGIVPAGSKRKRGGQKSHSVTPDDDDDEPEMATKRRKTKTIAPNSNAGPEVPEPMRKKMKAAFAECHKAVLTCEDEHGRRRCELFKELPDRRDYPDYYQLISQPISLAQIRKRYTSGTHYRNVQAFKADFTLMFNNARTYNQEGSWVYIDAEEMEKVFLKAFRKHVEGTDMPGATPAPVAGGSGGSAASYESALTPMEEDERPAPAVVRRGNKKNVVASDEEDDYLTPSDDE